jgi:hypothetical protein
MPVRQNVKTIVTPVEIMGEDAWVKIKNITIDEAKEFQRLSMQMDKEIKPEKERLYQLYADENELDVKALTDEQKSIAITGSELVVKAEKFFYDYFARYVMDWNWVLEDGSEMPKPSVNPEIFGKLTGKEFEYIQSLFKQDEKDSKN